MGRKMIVNDRIRRLEEGSEPVEEEDRRDGQEVNRTVGKL